MSENIPCVQLYYKSEYSLLHSTCKISSSFLLFKEYGYQSVAITDLSSMHGTLKFYHACKDAGIKPIIGLHVDYIYNDIPSSLLLYAMNTMGYKNLMRLSSKAKITNQPLTWEYISANAMGLLAVIPYRENMIYRFIEQNNIIEAKRHFDLIKMDINNIFLGISLLSDADKKLFSLVKEFAKQNNYSMCACNKISYLEMDEITAYQTLLSIDNGGELVSLSEQTNYEYLHSVDEMNIIYQNEPVLLRNTNLIAEVCNVEIGFNGYLLPKYDEELNKQETSAYLQELCIKGLKKRINQNNINNPTIYVNRLKYELDIINKMGFCDYFLIVWDYVKFAKKNGIYVGPGRGSAAASLVSYSLGITDMDPIYYNLLFERFLNPERISMPDIDIDFPDDVRDKVIEYVGKKYGNNRVAHIATFGTFKVKLALRDSARVWKTSENALKQVMKVIDSIDKKSIYLGTITLKEIINKSPELISLMTDYEEIDRLLNVATTIEGLPRNTSTHAAGIIITNYDLVNYTALDNGLDGIYQTQFEASDIESLGLLKMDFLGLRNLTTIDKCVKLIKFDYPDFVLPKDYNDEETFKMLASGDVDGVFQLESDGMRKVIMELKTSCFNDINHALALYRPGPMDSIPTFIKRKFKVEPVEYLHPDLESILKETYGMIVYQDQIMLIAHKFAKYSLGEADVLRRAVSKKKKQTLEKERIKFVDRSIKAGYDEKTADTIYDYIVKFANYGFNKAHSVAYAQISYITAYLKCHYFTYYLSTLMSGVMGSDGDIKKYFTAGIKKGVTILPPNINESKEEFSVYNKQIIFPLSVVKGLGIVKTKLILEERLHGSFVDYEDFVLRTHDLLPYVLVENLIYSGALDCFKLTKKAMIDNYQLILNRKEYDFFQTIKKEYANDEFSYGELLDKEKEMIGLNIKYNFFHQYQHLYDELHLEKIAEIKENTRVRTLGVLRSKKEIMTKKNEQMAFMSLEDENSRIELTVFPRVFERYPDLVIGQILIVSGNVQKRNDLQILVDEIKKV